MSKANAAAVNLSTSELAQVAEPQLHGDSFHIFGMPPRFELDKAQLTERYHQLMTAVHPDRFSVAPESERRCAMQWASRVNEAYRELLHPLSRARLLCELAAVPVDLLDTRLPSTFLAQQMEWREDYEALTDSSEAMRVDDRLLRTEQLESKVRQEAKQLIEKFAQSPLAQGARASADDLQLASDLIRQWMFVEKFIEDIEQQRMQWLEVLPS